MTGTKESKNSCLLVPLLHGMDGGSITDCPKLFCSTVWYTYDVYCTVSKHPFFIEVHNHIALHCTVLLYHVLDCTYSTVQNITSVNCTCTHVVSYRTYCTLSLRTVRTFYWLNLDTERKK